jgi:hypothetical protein
VARIGGARQHLAAGRRDRPVAQPDQQGPARHQIDRDGHQQQARRAAQQRELAAADGPQPAHDLRAERAGEHRRQVDQRDVQADAGGAEFQPLQQARRGDGRRDDGGR